LTVESRGQGNKQQQAFTDGTAFWDGIVLGEGTGSGRRRGGLSRGEPGDWVRGGKGTEFAPKKGRKPEGGKW